MVSRALIPCGGRGTRMLALTKGTPKELVEVGGLPVVVRVLHECRLSGIDEVLLVISPDKTGMMDRLASLAGDPLMPAAISFEIQSEPRGLADAIRLGRAFSAGEPIAVALPDNLFAGSEPGVAQVIETFGAAKKSVVAVVEITAQDAARRGPTSVYAGRVRGSEFVIDRIPDKRERGSTFDTGGRNAAFTGVGRFVFAPDVFDAIDAVEKTLPAGAELDDVPVMQHLLAAERLTGRKIDGRFFDVGLVSGYAEAAAEYGGAAAIA